jgi:F-type H+-transporting ATPase subunit b
MSLMRLILQEDHAAEAPNLFGLAEGMMFWTLVIFLVLLFVLRKWAFPPILGYAAAREKRIQDNLDEAKRERLEAERLLEEQRRELAEARQQAQGLIAEARQAADRARGELLNKARAEQEEIIARAKQEIQLERDLAVESMKEQAVDLALAAAGRLLEKRFGAEEDRRLVIDYLSRATPPSAGTN